MKITCFIILILIASIFVIGAGCEKESKLCDDACEDTERVQEIIEERFNLAPDEYVIECSECGLGRGVYMKARIQVKTGVFSKEPIELHYHWGWCSAGGTDCGWTMCFTSFSDKTEELYQSTRTKFCNKMGYWVSPYTGPYDCTNAKEVPRTERKRCEDFEIIEGNQKTISIKQINNRCNWWPEEGPYPCFEY